MKPTAKAAMLILVLISLSSIVNALGIGTFITKVEYTPNTLRTLEYYVVNDRKETAIVQVRLNGSLEPFASTRFNNRYWYSGKRSNYFDSILQREFDLTPVSSATFKFWTRYQIEDGWDYGRVQISTNNGSTWTTLKTYTGQSTGWPEWKQESIGISAYAGKAAIIRFLYDPDEAYVELGWMVDDISIPEIGFEDNVETGLGGWNTNAWIDNSAYILPSEKFSKFYIDFMIPDNAVADYVNSNANKIMINEIVESDDNSAWWSAPPSSVGVTGILPPLILLTDKDSDDDGVGDDIDKCSETSLPENVPTNTLLPNHFALTDADHIFEMMLESGTINITQTLIDSNYTLNDTCGCSCDQILRQKPGYDLGLIKYGCSEGMLGGWISQGCSWPAQSGGGTKPQPKNTAQYLTPHYVATYDWKKIKPRKKITMDIKQKNSPINKIIFSMYSEASNVAISVSKMQDKPEFVKPGLGHVHSYTRFIAKNLNNNYMESATLEFEVEENWLEMVNAKPEDVVMSVYAYGEWYDIPTKQTGKGGNKAIYYEAVADRLSLFAIRIKGDMQLKDKLPEKPILRPTGSVIQDLDNQSKGLGLESEKIALEESITEKTTVIAMENVASITKESIVLLALMALVMTAILYSVKGIRSYIKRT